MPRRWKVDGQICHVFNRAAAKVTLFHSAADYRAFLGIMSQARDQSHGAVRLYGYCLMPNHWHFIICADTTADLSKFMQRVSQRHARAFIEAHPERSGAIYQGRFRCVPVQSGWHLRTVLLYVDRNPLRAHLAQTADGWLWSSVLHHAGIENDPLLEDLPPALTREWLSALTAGDPVDALTRAALRRCQPVGEASWIAELGEDWNRLQKKRGRPGKSVRD